MTIYIANIEAKGDVAFFAAKTQDDLNEAVAKWCRDNWEGDEIFDLNWENEKTIMEYFYNNTEDSLQRGTAQVENDIPFVQKKAKIPTVLIFVRGGSIESIHATRGIAVKCFDQDNDKEACDKYAAELEKLDDYDDIAY